MNQKKWNLKKFLTENYMIAIVLVFFAGYYMYRLFAITPTYDEVYTYIHFINEGPMYSATHWPLPNNHLFFSVLSSLFTWTGVYGGLRLVSYLAAMGTMILLYALMKRVYSRGIAIFGVMLYGMFLLTNVNAVQGRGYSLATFMLALALFCGYQIACENGGRRYYILWMLALWLGLYTLVSSVYWVAAVCVCFGIVLLLYRKIKQLLRLVLYSVYAAILTLLSYAFLWINMGAQSIQAELGLSDGAFQVFLDYPRTCLMRGFEQMQSNQYMQGVDRGAFVHDFKYFFRDILFGFIDIQENASFRVFCILILVLFVIGMIRMVLCLMRKESVQMMQELPGVLLATVGYVVMYVVLWIQSAYPYTRVFSYMGVFLALTAGLILTFVMKLFGALFAGLSGGRLQQGRGLQKISGCLIYLNIPIFVFCMITMCNARHNEEYYMRDYYALDAARQIDWRSGVDTYVTDEIYARQQIIYHYELGEKLSIQETTESPDVIIVCKDENNGAWPFIRSAEEMERIGIQNRNLIYENEMFLVYQ